LGFKATNTSDPYRYRTLDVPDGVDEARALRLTVANLKKYTQYSVVVRAFNRVGAGPKNDPIVVTTGEDGERAEWWRGRPLD